MAFVPVEKVSYFTAEQKFNEFIHCIEIW